MNESMNNDSPRSGPPWIQPAIQQQIRWRENDVVISVPAKSGTTWTMNIVHQLFTGGTTDFRDIYEEVPWIEFLGHPAQTHQEVVERLDAMSLARRRAFKTHSAPPAVPFFAAGASPRVKYIVVFRNPEEALVSFRPFIDQHTDDWFDLWQVPREALCRADFRSFYHEVVDAKRMQANFFGFLDAWWPLRKEPNVLFLHYSDMKREHDATMRKVAQFLGLEPTVAQWKSILEYTSFRWMKQHEEKFEARTISRVPLLETGAMIRQGEAGKADCDGMTADISRHLRQIGGEICRDPAAVDWYYGGGPLP